MRTCHHLTYILVGFMLVSPGYAEETTIKVRGYRQNTQVDPDRPTAKTTKKQLEERQPQSTPDALSYAPGVYVQQTAHGQGSPYIRGRTGQQTLLLFDGLRLNHALFRKGPNQYLFTVDSKTVGSLEVIRGSASVELGNDAISGAILINPLEPSLDPTASKVIYRPSLSTYYSSADNQLGGRMQLDAQFGSNLGLVAGMGGRFAGQLEAGGNAFPDGRAPGQVCETSLSVPCFESDGRTQRGTGFEEITGDARLVYATTKHRVTFAAYGYRQYDAPRTDQCPAPEAAVGECLVYDEQFRTHVYAKYEADLQKPTVDTLQLALSYQRQHQSYQLIRPDRNPADSFDTTNINGGRDAVDGFSGYGHGQTAKLDLGGELKLTARYGVDASLESVESRKWIQFAEPVSTRLLSRGQYIEGSRYLQGGAYVAPALEWGNLRLRTGTRYGIVNATSPGDPSSASKAFDHHYTPFVSNVGLRWGRRIVFLVNVEQGFRAPNLDDLVARQSTGQGYQLNNPNLEPERALTYEAGFTLKLDTVDFEILGFRQELTEAIERRLLTPADCVLSNGFVDQACRANRAPMKLVNLPGTALITGGEVRIRYQPIHALNLRTTISYARGDGENPNPEKTGRTPLSRIPPLNGNFEVSWKLKRGIYTGAAVRWASKQERLSMGDMADSRIPTGGTPGYAVYDLRAGIRLSGAFRFNILIQNLTDMRYRTHGSGVYAPGRSLVITGELFI
jgi:outer membrane receptor protein involved in Fe transport